MSITDLLPARRSTAWDGADAAALAVADVTSIHVSPHTVRAVVDETTRRHGGPDLVRAELALRMADAPLATARTLDWALRTIAEVNPQ